MFAEMPLDNRAVVKFTLPPATADFAEVFPPFGASRPAKRSNISQATAVL
jgi:hypothetical protein